MDGCLMEVCEVTKVYGTAIQTKVLKGINLAFQKGEFASLIGYSGSGKTTLLNILGALDRPTAGTVKFNGTDLTAMNDAALSYFRNRNLGFVFQSHLLLPEFNVLENVLMPTWINQAQSDPKSQNRAKELLELVGLKDHIYKKTTAISGGQQQRVAIARALVNNPTMILADEPTGNLDSETTEKIYALLRDINREMSTAFLVVTHNDHIAAKSDRVIEMRDGQIIKDYNTKDKDSDTVWSDLAPKYCKFCGNHVSPLQ